MSLKYKNYIAEVHYIANTSCFYGEVVNNEDTIVFQAEYSSSLEEALQIAVEQYCWYLNTKATASTQQKIDLTTVTATELSVI